MPGAGPNAEQIEYWNEQAGPKWVEQSERLDAMLALFGQAALSRAQPRAAERVLDIGCGAGWTTLELAKRVGANGSVLGVDISEPLLALARARARGMAQARFEQADAQTHAFAPGSADLVFSRFGVMFFADPTAAFANLARALAPGGRVTFVCWQALAQNAWMREPLTAIAKHVSMPAPPPPDAPGPFAFADPARVRGILEGAGLRNVLHEPLTGMLSLGPDAEQATAFALQVGPASRALADVTPAQREVAIRAIRDALASVATPRGVELGYAAWIVSASR